MKRVIPVIGLLFCSVYAHSQASSDTLGMMPATTTTPPPAAEVGVVGNVMASHKLKNKDQVLPRKFVEVNYRTGWLSQDITMVDLATSYTNSLSTSRYTNPTYSGTKAYGGDFQFGYFLGKSRRIGVGIGAQYMQYSGTMTMSEFRADYQALDDKNRIYRQIVTSNGNIKEDVKITNVNVPLVAKFKYHFPKSNFGITADAGGLFGIYNETKHDVSGTFNYEVVYKLSPDKTSVVSGFDNGTIPNSSTSLVLTEGTYKATNPEKDAILYFDGQRSQEGGGYNVGLRKSTISNERTGSNNYNKISLGVMAQLGLSYTLSYNVNLTVSGFYTYQSYQSSDNGNYRMTEKVLQEGSTYYGNYNGMTAGIKKSVYTNYGITAGLRIFFGEKSDIDGDGIIDLKDNCMYVYGSALKNGCPDRDGDGVVDDEDGCPDEFGSEYANGCPDRDGDGFADKSDECPDVPGEYKGCTAEFIAAKTRPELDLVDQTGSVMAPHVVLETSTVNFDYNKATIPDSTISSLKKTVKLLEKNPKVVIHISGFTDDIGSYASNLILSYERAKAIKNYMVTNGIAESRVIISAYGMDNPVSINNSDVNRAKNRRIEFKLLLPI